MLIYQAYYWDCPKSEGKEGDWWNYLRTLLPLLREDGFDVLYLPPPYKGGGGRSSMGFDPYDYFDLGEFNQRGAVETFFGTKIQLENLIAEAHRLNMKVITELVISHCSGADEEEDNWIAAELAKLPAKRSWTKFHPASNRFPRNRECFYPSVFAPVAKEEPWGPTLCFENPYVSISIVRLVEWLIDEIDFDGFRFDYAISYGHEVINRIIRKVVEKKRSKEIFFFAEHWGKEDTIGWLYANEQSGGYPFAAMDLPLRGLLKQMCEQGDFDLRSLATAPAGTTILSTWPAQAVTFVDNMDMKQNLAIGRDKILAYSYILLHEGIPTVFILDYRPDMEPRGAVNAMRQLLRFRSQFRELAPPHTLLASNDLYVMSRDETDGKRGLVYILSTSAQEREVTVELEKLPASVRVEIVNPPVAVASDLPPGNNFDQRVRVEGTILLCAVPPRGYVVCSVKYQEAHHAA